MLQKTTNVHGKTPDTSHFHRPKRPQQNVHSGYRAKVHSPPTEPGQGAAGLRLGGRDQG